MIHRIAVLKQNLDRSKTVPFSLEIVKSNRNEENGFVYLFFLQVLICLSIKKQMMNM